MAIALLCAQAPSHRTSMRNAVSQMYIDCQQYYVHCVNTKSGMTQPEAMTKCVMERKL